MTLTQSWCAQYTDKQNEAQALSAWVSVCPDADDWTQWLTSTSDCVGPRLMAGLGQDKESWTHFLLGAMKCDVNKKSSLHFLNMLRSDDALGGKKVSFFPLACLEALNEVIGQATEPWKQSMLLRSPDYWFGPSQDLDPAGVAPLHELSIKLFCSSAIPAKRLPALAWSPSALYDNYGSAPQALQPLLAPIQHALEYAVYMHQTQGKKDQLAHAEMHGYFQKYNVDMGTFETLVDLAHNTPTLGSYVQVLHAMVAPEQEQYDMDITDDAP